MVGLSGVGESFERFWSLSGGILGFWRLSGGILAILRKFDDFCALAV